MPCICGCQACRCSIPCYCAENCGCEHCERWSIFHRCAICNKLFHWRLTIEGDSTNTCSCFMNESNIVNGNGHRANLSQLAAPFICNLRNSEVDQGVPNFISVGEDTALDHGIDNSISVREEAVLDHGIVNSISVSKDAVLDQGIVNSISVSEDSVLDQESVNSISVREEPVLDQGINSISVREESVLDQGIENSNFVNQEANFDPGNTDSNDICEEANFNPRGCFYCKDTGVNIFLCPECFGDGTVTVEPRENRQHDGDCRDWCSHCVGAGRECVIPCPYCKRSKIIYDTVDIVFERLMSFVCLPTMYGFYFLRIIFVTWCWNFLGYPNTNQRSNLHNESRFEESNSKKCWTN